MTSLCDVTTVRSALRANALSSFQHFVDVILSLPSIEDTVFQDVQDVVADRADAVIHTARPHSVAAALNAWLTSQGVEVLCPVQLPRSEVLQWLDLEEAPPCDQSAVLDLVPHGVRITWV